MSNLTRDERHATREDEKVGIRETAEFFGRGQRKMFGCRHVPGGKPIGGAVICPALQAESVRNYRREVELGRYLASRGFATQRFHYRGTGNSDGETADATFETMRDDAVEAAEWLRQAAGIDSIAYFGARWGAMIAGSAAARFDGAPLVLWEPMTEARSYFRDLFRAVAIHELKAGTQSQRSSDEQLEELRRAGSLDILGYSVDRGLYESVAGRTLEAEVGREPRPVLTVQISRGPGLRKEYAGLANRWREVGFAVDTLLVEGSEEPWWFAGGRDYEEEQALAERLATLTGDWIVRVVNQRGMTG